jgi:acetyl esterase
MSCDNEALTELQKLSNEIEELFDNDDTHADEGDRIESFRHRAESVEHIPNRDSMSLDLLNNRDTTSSLDKALNELETLRLLDKSAVNDVAIPQFQEQASKDEDKASEDEDKASEDEDKDAIIRKLPPDSVIDRRSSSYTATDEYLVRWSDEDNNSFSWETEEDLVALGFTNAYEIIATTPRSILERRFGERQYEYKVEWMTYKRSPTWHPRSFMEDIGAHNLIDTYDYNVVRRLVDRRVSIDSKMGTGKGTSAETGHEQFEYMVVWEIHGRKDEWRSRQFLMNAGYASMVIEYDEELMRIHRRQRVSWNVRLYRFMLLLMIVSTIAFYINGLPDIPLSSAIIVTMTRLFLNDVWFNIDNIISIRNFFNNASVFIEMSSSTDIEIINIQRPKGVSYRIYESIIDNGEDIDNRPVLLFYHGGAFVLGSIYENDALCVEWATEWNYTVISVNYRKAPENPFPAAVDDALSALRFTMRRWPTRQIFIAGESAGANLAAVTTARWYKKILRDHKRRISGLLLVYPCIYPLPYDYGVAIEAENDNVMKSSHREYESYNYLLTLAQIKEAWAMYTTKNTKQLQKDYRINPTVLQSRRLFEKWPPTMAVIAEKDILADDTKDLVSHLIFYGAPHVEVKSYNDIHGFFGRFGYTKEAMKDAMKSLHKMYLLGKK